MRFALLGDHPDGVEMACAVVESGRHQVVAYTAMVDEKTLRRWGDAARKVSDAEEVLADPAVEVVIVAGPPGARPAQLRRAVQSERHVLCVYPPDQTPEIGYEAGMIQRDTGCVVLPILPEPLHPGIRRLGQFVHRPGQPAEISPPPGAFGLLEIERAVTGEVLDGLWVAGQKPSFPGWDILRALGGEVQEVSAFAEQEELRAGEPILVSGRFERGGLFLVTLLPRQAAAHWRLTVIGSTGRAELVFPIGWHGPAFLDWRDENGDTREESWDPWDPWPTLVELVEQAVQHRTLPAPLMDWQDAIHLLELDDAARRSVERRRSSVLEYPEASEEVGFKGTMTLVGCAMLWSVLLLLILSRWWPWLGWLIGPVLALFLVLQLLRYLIPRPPSR